VTATPDVDDTATPDVELQLGLDDVAAPAPVRGKCRQCGTAMHLAAGILPLHPTLCPCQRRHPPGARCPFITTCPGSHRKPR
jgi:hypothetical protein